MSASVHELLRAPRSAPEAEPTDCAITGCTAGLLRERRDDEPALCAYHRIMFRLARYEEACHQAKCGEHRSPDDIEQIRRTHGEAVEAGAHDRELAGARDRGHMLARQHRRDRISRDVQREQASGLDDSGRW